MYLGCGGFRRSTAGRKSGVEDGNLCLGRRAPNIAQEFHRGARSRTNGHLIALLKQHVAAIIATFFGSRVAGKCNVGDELGGIRVRACLDAGTELKMASLVEQLNIMSKARAQTEAALDANT